MSASTNLLADAQTVITNGPNAATVALAIAQAEALHNNAASLYHSEGNTAMAGQHKSAAEEHADWAESHQI